VWEERAVTAAKEDEAKTLECIKRRNQSRGQKEQAAAMLARHDEIEREVGVTVARIEERITTLTQQRNALRSRHSAADALRVINRIEDTSAHGIEDIFDRWEMLIAETEYASGDTRHSDSFEAAYTQQESDASLKADLDALLKKPNA
jgi:phage shock protein A